MVRGPAARRTHQRGSAALPAVAQGGVALWTNRYPGPISSSYEVSLAGSSLHELMKGQFWKLDRLLWVLCLCVWAGAPRVFAQSRPSLGLRFSAGQPTVTVTGTVGTI